MTNHTITIVTNPKFSLAKYVRSFIGVAVVICIGIAMDSTEMQWLGFIAMTLFVVAASSSEISKNRTLTIAEARRRLDEIEREEAQ